MSHGAAGWLPPQRLNPPPHLCPLWGGWDAPLGSQVLVLVQSAPAPLLSSHVQTEGAALGLRRGGTAVCPNEISTECVYYLMLLSSKRRISLSADILA